MKKQAIIVRWDATRGFGFMRSADTPTDVFFHVKDWAGGSERPAEGLSVVYEEIHVGGKGPRGVAVRPVGQAAAPRSHAPRNSQRRGTPTANGNAAPMIVLMLAYAGFLGWALYGGRVPVAAALIVLGASAVTFLAYAWDKSAAERGAWRTAESTLHAMSLIGGWPGAWFAQRLLRHKSRKASFRAVYWGMVMRTSAWSSPGYFVEAGRRIEEQFNRVLLARTSLPSRGGSRKCSGVRTLPTA